MEHIDERLKLVKELINISKKIDVILKELSRYGWDYDGDGIELSLKDIIYVLKMYIDGRISQTNVEEWGNAIEMREDIFYDDHNYETIEGLIFELANPELTEPLTKYRAKIIIDKIK